jgi:undecaprenyl-phosphate galactose phosphotransferase
LVICWIVWAGLFKKTYTHRRPLWGGLKQLLRNTLVFCAVDCVLYSLGKQGIDAYSTATTYLSLLILLPALRRANRMFLDHFGLWKTPTLIIGNGDNARKAYKALQSEPGMGFDIHAFAWPTFMRSNKKKETNEPAISNIRTMSFGKTQADAETLQHFHCVIALEASEWQEREMLIRQLSHMAVANLHVIPAMRGVPLHGMETSDFFSHEVLLIHLGNNLANPFYRLCKRVFDVVGSASLLLLLSPLLGLVAYKVSRDGGQAFFGHVRVGQNGQPFKCYKFRSMVVNAQEVLQHLLASDPVAQAEWNQDFKLKNDPRVSKLGHLLRRTSLDELPQLWNVFKGEMSLVGPRPIVQAELERYADDVDYYLMTKPGMTGLWQVSGRNDVDYATRVYLDSWYVKNWSLWSDIAILFKTIGVVTKRSGAY